MRSGNTLIPLVLEAGISIIADQPLNGSVTGVDRRKRGPSA